MRDQELGRRAEAAARRLAESGKVWVEQPCVCENGKVWHRDASLAAGGRVALCWLCDQQGRFWSPGAIGRIPTATDAELVALDPGQ